MKTAKINHNQEVLREILDKLAEVWEAEDFDSCKVLLKLLCDYIPPDGLASLFLKDLDAAIVVFELFVITGLNNAPNGTPARAFYLRLVMYLIYNEHPGDKQVLWEAFNHFFPDVKPVGFYENGDRLYSLKALAQGFGVSMEELMNEPEKLPDIEFFSTEIPGDVTIH